MIKHTQTIRRQKPTKCFSVRDHFVRLALKGLTILTGKNCVLHNSVQEWLHLFHMFTQLIKYYTFYYHLLKSTDAWKMWFIKWR